MTVQTLTRPLRRLRGVVPTTVAAGARFLTHGALENARRAQYELSAAVRDRRQLGDDLTDGVGAGTLDRLSQEECEELLSSRSVGRLAYVARAGLPDIVPVNYRFDGEAIVIRSGPGPKLQAAERRELVAFEVDDVDERTHSGWSVVVHGVARQVAQEPVSDEDGPHPWAQGPRRHTIMIPADRVVGRRLVSPDV